MFESRLNGSGRHSDLFCELTKALHEESEALIANDSSRLAAASSRKQHLLRILAPHASSILPTLPRDA